MKLQITPFSLFYKPQLWIYRPEYLWYSFINPTTHIEDQNPHHLSLHGNLNIEKPSCRSQSLLWSWGCLESSGKLWKSQWLDSNPEQISKHHGDQETHNCSLQSSGVWNMQVSLRLCLSTGHLEFCYIPNNIPLPSVLKAHKVKKMPWNFKLPILQM